MKDKTIRMKPRRRRRIAFKGIVNQEISKNIEAPAGTPVKNQVPVNPGR